MDTSTLIAGDKPESIMTNPKSYRAVWLAVLVTTFAISVANATTESDDPRVIGPVTGFWIALIAICTCSAAAIVGLWVANRDDLAELGIISAFFFAISVLPVVHGLLTVAAGFSIDRTTVSLAFWSMPLGLAVAAPLLAAHSSLTRRILHRWRLWVFGWMAVMLLISAGSIFTPLTLFAPASGTAFAFFRGLLCCGLCLVMSVRHLRLSELSRSVAGLFVSLGFLLAACSSLRWLGAEPFREGFWIQTTESAVATQLCVVLAAIAYAQRKEVRDILRPITMWDPISAFEIGVDPAIKQLVEDLRRKDVMTRDHVVRTSALAVTFAQRLKIPSSQVREIGIAALLHDVGKLEVPDSILLKPSALAEDEWAVMKLHPITGARIVGESLVFQTAAPAVHAHHERWDGTGYPSGTAGSEIPYFARVIAVCDAVDAMSFTRRYQSSKPVDEIIETLHSGAGGQWDPELAKAMVALLLDTDQLPDTQMFNSDSEVFSAELEFCVPDDPRPASVSQRSEVPPDASIA